MLRILSSLKNSTMTNNVLILMKTSRSVCVFRRALHSWPIFSHVSSMNAVKTVSLSSLSHNYCGAPEINTSKCNGVLNCLSSGFNGVSQQYENAEENNSRKSFSYRGAVLMMGPLSFLFKKNEDEEEITIERTIAKALFEERKGHIHEAEKMMHEALNMAFAEKNEQAVTYIYDQMANMSLRQDRFEEAETAFKETMRRMISSGTEKTDPAIIEISLKLAQIYSATSRVTEAQHGFRWCLETTEARLNVVQTLASPSTSKTEEKKTESSNTDQESTKNTEYIKNLQALLGMCLEGYARFFAKYKKLDDAIELYKRALFICENELAEDGLPHYETISLLNDLGTVFDMKGDHDQARDYIRRSLKLAQTLGDLESLPVIVCNLASVEANRGHFDEAKRLYRKALSESERQGDARTVVVIKNKIAQLETDIFLKKKKASKAS